MYFTISIIRNRNVEQSKFVDFYFLINFSKLKLKFSTKGHMLPHLLHVHLAHPTGYDSFANLTKIRQLAKTTYSIV